MQNAYKKIALLIPCYNEEKGISIVLDNIPHQRLRDMGYSVEPIVIDNSSQDKTAEIAVSKGAKLITEHRKGKGFAMLAGFNNIPLDASIVAMIDGDASYDVRELPRLVEPIDNGFGEVIIGTRLNGRIQNGSMPKLNRYGNWMFTFLARTLYKTNVTDVCSGFFAWKRYVVDNLAHEIKSKGFSLEMEMIVKMAKLDFSCYSVPISYHERSGATSLHPLKDGMLIMMEAFRHYFWKPNPLVVREIGPPSYDHAQNPLEQWQSSQNN